MRCVNYAITGLPPNEGLKPTAPPVERTPLLSFTSEEKRHCPSVTQRAVGKGEVFTRQPRRPQHPARRHTSMEASTPQVGRPRLKRPLSTSCESPPKIFSATQMLQFQLATEALLPTGLRDVDWLLGGGLATGEVTEIFGGPGVGKSQLCMLVSAMQALCTMGTALYIDTSGQFSAQRLFTLFNATATRERLSRDECKPRLSRQLRVLTTTTLPELLCELDAIDDLLRRGAAPVGVVDGASTSGSAPSPVPEPTSIDTEWTRHLRVVVVDSVFSVCCGERVEEADTAAGAQLARLGARLRDLARRHRLAVLVTNAARLESTTIRHGAPPTEARPPRPALGVAWYSTAHARVLMYRNANDDRTVVQLLHHGLTARKMPQTAALTAKVYVKFGPDGTVTSERSLTARA